MAVKTVKAKHKKVSSAVNGKAATKIQAALDYEALLTEIENDPDAPLIAKEAVAYRRIRDRSGEPYLTIEQIQAELGRG